MLQTKVKAGAITHLTDARYFAAWEVEWLGFALSPGDGFSASAAQLMALREWVDGVNICGEFTLADADFVREAAAALSLDAVQVDMLTDADALRALQGQVVRIQEVVIEGYADFADLDALLHAHADAIEYFLLNFTKGGLTWDDLADGAPVSREQLHHWAVRYPLLLDIHTGSTPPSQLLAQLPIRGFALQGSEEEKVGFKSFDELDTFFEDLEVLV